MPAFLFKKIKNEGETRAVKGFDKLVHILSESMTINASPICFIHFSYEDQNTVLKRCKEPLNPPRPIEVKGTKDKSHSPTPLRENTKVKGKAGSSKANSVSGAKSTTKGRKHKEKLDGVEVSDGEKEIDEQEENTRKKKKKTAVKK
jgi:hypothetical protein